MEMGFLLSKTSSIEIVSKEITMEIHRWVMAIAFPTFLLALPLCAHADDMKDIREIRECLIRIEERMVTKDELKSEITSVKNELKSEITSVRNELQLEIASVRNELKSEITSVRNELKSEIKDVREEIKDVRGEIKDVRTEVKEFMLWGFGVTFAGIFALIGFVLWDRRTALVPAIRKNSELEEREERVEQALKEIAIKDGNVREALRHVGILPE